MDNQLIKIQPNVISIFSLILVSLLQFVFVCHGAESNGLKLWYNMEVGTSTTITDIVTVFGQTGHTGTFGAAATDPEYYSTTNCKLGQWCVNFDADDKVTTGVQAHNFITGSAGTITAWIYISSTTGACGSDVPYNCPGIVGDTGGFFGIKFAPLLSGSCTTNCVIAFNYDGNNDHVGYPYTANTWEHVAWVHGGGTLYIYKNGALQASTASGDTLGLTGNVSLGASYTSASAGMRLDEVRIYNRALSAAEIRSIFSKGASSHGIGD